MHNEYAVERIILGRNVLKLTSLKLKSEHKSLETFGKRKEKPVP